MAGSEIHTVVAYDHETHFDVNKNKFVYTTKPVACDWAGAVMPENHEKSEEISDRPTNIVNYRD